MLKFAAFVQARPEHRRSLQRRRIIAAEFQPRILIDKTSPAGPVFVSINSCAQHTQRQKTMKDLLVTVRVVRQRAVGVSGRAASGGK